MIWKSTDFSRHGYCSLYAEVVSKSKEKCFKSNVQQYNKDFFFPLFRCDRLRIIPLLHFLVEAQVILCTLRSSDSESQLVFVCTFVKQ